MSLQVPWKDVKASKITALVEEIITRTLLVVSTQLPGQKLSVLLIDPNTDHQVAIGTSSDTQTLLSLVGAFYYWMCSYIKFWPQTGHELKITGETQSQPIYFGR